MKANKTERNNMIDLFSRVDSRIRKEHGFDLSLAICRTRRYYVSLYTDKHSDIDHLSKDQLSDAVLMFANLFESINDLGLIKDICKLLSYKKNFASGRDPYLWNALDFYYQILIKKEHANNFQK